jgi:putative tryptophan/tyrosine transport system substrate-binding protein
VKRRTFIAGLGSAVTALPLTSLAQQQMPLVGFLNSASPDTYRFNADSFREGLTKAGASSTVPVVFTIGGDPVRHGLVESINRPGGRVTGILFNQNVLGAKRVELLREVAPNASRVALLMNPTNPNVKIEQEDAEAGAKTLGLQAITFSATNPKEIEAAFEQLLSAKVDGLITATDPIVLDRREQIVSFAHRHKLPVVGFVRQFAALGALLSYGPSISWMYRQAGEYIGQILKGSNPGEMPVLQPTQFELVINLKTAHAFGLQISALLLARADEVIE